MRIHRFHWAMVVVGLSLAGCSTGPEPPKPGSPAFLWGGAQTTYKAGDFLRAGENLQQLIKTDNEYTAKSRPWAMVVSAGIAQGYLDLAEAYDIGAKANRQNPTPFIREAGMLRSLASGAALEFAETVHRFQVNDKEANVGIAFEYPPAGAVTPPASMERIKTGVLIQESERESLKKSMIQRGVLLAVCAALGNTEDVAKTQEMMKAADLKVTRPDFMLAMAKSLNEISTVFGPAKLDRPDRLKVLLLEASEALKVAPENKDSKALKVKIEATMKKSKISA